MKISSASQQTGNASADQMMSSMKIMSYSMCVVSAVLCYTLPAGLGLYWTVSSFVQVVIQILLNRHFRDMDVDTIIKENLEKVNKKSASAERIGIIIAILTPFAGDVLKSIVKNEYAFLISARFSCISSIIFS